MARARIIIMASMAVFPSVVLVIIGVYVFYNEVFRCDYKPCSDLPGLFPEGRADPTAVILSLITVISATISTVSTIWLAWRAERRSAREFELKIEKLELELREARATASSAKK
jgi:hypothetical protein